MQGPEEGQKLPLITRFTPNQGHARPKAGRSAVPSHLTSQTCQRGGLQANTSWKLPYCWNLRLFVSKRGATSHPLPFCQPCPSRGSKAFELSCFAAGQAPRNITHKEQQTNRHMARTTPPPIPKGGEGGPKIEWRGEESDPRNNWDPHPPTL